MAFVLDVSVALSWVFPDEQNEETRPLFQRLAQETTFVPAIWPLETGNALYSAIKSGRINEDQVRTLADDLLDLPVEMDRLGREDALRGTLKAAMKSQISIYDAAYLELAQRRGLPLATLDRRLREACSELNIQVLPAHV